MMLHDVVSHVVNLLFFSFLLYLFCSKESNRSVLVFLVEFFDWNALSGEHDLRRRRCNTIEIIQLDRREEAKKKITYE